MSVAATKQSPADGEETPGEEHNDDADADDENDAEMSRQLQRHDAMQVNTLAGHSSTCPVKTQALTSPVFSEQCSSVPDGLLHAYI